MRSNFYFEHTPTKALLTSCTPEPHESFRGYVSRCAMKTSIRKMHTFYKLAGLTTSVPHALILAKKDDPVVRNLSKFLRAEVPSVEDFAMIVREGHLTPHDYRRYNGADLPVSAFSWKLRRVAPRGLAAKPIHLNVWDILILGFDPATREKLISKCPVCTANLDWVSATHPFACAACVDDNHRHTTDLRDFPQPSVETDDDEALQFICNLIDPRGNAGENARRHVHAQWTALPNNQILEMALILVRWLAAPYDRKTVWRPRNIDYHKFTPEILARSARAIMRGPAGITELDGEVVDETGKHLYKAMRLAREHTAPVREILERALAKRFYG